MPTETELKLQLPVHRNAALRQLMAQLCGLAPGDTPASHTLLSRYYDTPQAQLHRRGISLRLRQQDGQWQQTLKQDDAANLGLHARREQSLPRPDASLALFGIKGRKLRHWLCRHDIADALVPVFSTDIQRCDWLYHDAAGNVMTVSLDRGSIVAAGRSLAVNELEIELQSGRSDALLALALRLADTLPLLPERRSKAERGFALCHGAAANVAQHAGVATLTRDMTPDAAQRQLVRHALQQFQDNSAGMLDSDDPEFVHQARIALRRLQTAQQLALRRLQTAQQLAQQPAEAHWSGMRARARHMAGVLGRARDADVLQLQILPRIEASLQPPADLRLLHAALQQTREQCRQRTRAALQSAQNGHVQLQLLTWLQQPAPHEKPGLHRHAARLLQRLHRRVARRGRAWAQLDSEQRHALRKQAKRLRYAAEFFAPLYPRRKVARYLAPLRALLDQLGDLNDLAVAARQLPPLATQHPALLPAISLCQDWLAQQAPHDEHALARACRQQRKAPRFW